MKHAPYQLSPVTPEQSAYLHNWFDSQQDLDQWGGDGFYFPIRALQFLQQLYLPGTQSYWLYQHRQRVAFGQLCDRFDCNHLARLLVHPESRGQGHSKTLIKGLIAQGLQQHPQRDFSLFVYRKNLIAVQCYQQLGFSEAEQPGESDPLLYFLKLNNKQARQLLKDHQDANLG